MSHNQLYFERFLITRAFEHFENDSPRFPRDGARTSAVPFAGLLVFVMRYLSRFSTDAKSELTKTETLISFRSDLVACPCAFWREK